MITSFKTRAAPRLHHRSNSLDRDRFFAIKKLFATFRFHGIRIVRQECTWDLSWMMQLLFASDAFSKKELPTRYNSQSSQKGKVYCSRDPQSWKGCLYHKSQCIMWNRKLTRSFSCNLNRSPSFNPKFLINVQSASDLHNLVKVRLQDEKTDLERKLLYDMTKQNCPSNRILLCPKLPLLLLIDLKEQFLSR